jgi:hypothetical protein
LRGVCTLRLRLDTLARLLAFPESSIWTGEHFRRRAGNIQLSKWKPQVQQIIIIEEFP